MIARAKIPWRGETILFGLFTRRATAVTRRVERSIFPLFEEKQIRSEIFIFINRLSRLFFSVERWEKFQNNEGDEKLEQGKKLPFVPRN